MRKFEVVSQFAHLGIIIPTRATKASAGYDLASIEDVLIKPGEIKLIKTGLKAKNARDRSTFCVSTLKSCA